MKILEKHRCDFQLKTQNPFIITMHHKDFFPKGNGEMAPVSYIPGRETGNDFDLKAPWRMYHGDIIPGFPVHPHRGFETVTIVTQGVADHSDSQGAFGRYGEGDVQWMTAGEGIQHSEMFPLIHEDKENTMELFQVWLNLPRKSKFVPSHYKMLWAEEIPVVRESQENGSLEIKVIAGEYNGTKALDPTPHSWAAAEENHVGIWLIKMEGKAKLTIPKGTSTMSRTLYHYEGDSVEVEGQALEERYYLDLKADEEIEINSIKGESRFLLLEGERINEPVTAYGPFVMNTQEEVMQAYSDYRATRFGGWPWDNDAPVHDKHEGRFAYYGNGKKEYPPKADS
ncbi:pirin family protein [Lacrimispora sp.]|uniref:pirin family protein n=1 Tax=Lacrimispora sp. TaxID=2719234 RepID=UPI00345FE0EB